MEQHPIPQNISSYEFRLVGDMTLKQFLQLAAGIVLAIIIYRLPLPGLVRYPLVFASVVLGITLAFVPINGRPFIRYVWAFLFAIYAPTEFVWHHQDKVTPTALPPTAPPVPESATPTSSITESKLQPESHPVVTTTPVSATPSAIEPSPAPQGNQTTASVYTAPTQASPSPTNTTVTTQVDTGPAISDSTEAAPIAPQPVYSATSETTQLDATISLPEPASTISPSTTSAIPTNLIIRPESPNILTGVVTTSEGNPIENVIVEIIDTTSGIPARALRTNRLGQFQIATPLSVGSYTLQAEKTGLEFAPVRIEAKNAIIEPILLTPIA